MAKPGESEEPLHKAVSNELATVIDPDLGLALTELGLIYDLTIDSEGRAFIAMTFTSMGCPIGPQLVENVRNAALQTEGITDAEVDVVWDPPWDPTEMASEVAKIHLGIY